MITLRAGVVADADEIARILVACWQEVYAPILTQAQRDQIVWEKQRARHVKYLTAGTTYRVALDGEQMVGFASFGKSRFQIIRDEYELYTIYVRPTHLRHGIGALLLRVILDQVEPTGKSLGLLTFSNNPCRGFYDQHGFRPAGSETNDVHGREETYVYYTNRAQDGVA